MWSGFSGADNIASADWLQWLLLGSRLLRQGKQDEFRMTAPRKSGD
jgi:hypothetical protein